MRPVNKVEGVYHASERLNAYGMGRTNEARALALCCKFQYDRLHGIINGIGGATQAIAAAIDATIGGIVGDVVDTAIPIPVVPNPMGGPNYFGGGAFWLAINAVPVADRALVELYAHYRTIMINLQYNITGNAFTAPLMVVPAGRLYISDVPYAASAMSDTIEALRVADAAFPGSLLYSEVLLGVTRSSIGIPMAPPICSFNLANLRTLLRNHYATFALAPHLGVLPYTNAVVELVQALGPYCAYCEANLKTQIDVEHILPKGVGATLVGISQGFSPFSREWHNFLPSCPRCNSTKNARPTKIDVTNGNVGLAYVKQDRQALVGGNIALDAGGGGDTRLTEWEYYQLMGNAVQLPTENTSFRNTGYQLWNHTLGAADNTAVLGQLNWTIVRVNEDTKTVRVNVAGPGVAAVMVDYQLRIDVVAAPANPVRTNPASVGRVNNMVNICNLNAPHANTDRRLLERTEAWFMALAAVHRMDQELTAFNAGGANTAVLTRIYNLWREGIMTTIKEKGFFSVWMKVLNGVTLNLLAPAPPHGVNFAVANLATDVAGQLNATGYFPGTVWANVP